MVRPSTVSWRNCCMKSLPVENGWGAGPAPAGRPTDITAVGPTSWTHRGDATCVGFPCGYWLIRSWVRPSTFRWPLVTWYMYTAVPVTSPLGWNLICLVSPVKSIFLYASSTVARSAFGPSCLRTWISALVASYASPEYVPGLALLFNCVYWPTKVFAFGSVLASPQGQVR